MANNDNGMLFFFDWKPVFEKLSGKEVKDLLLAMLNYRENGVEPPKFTGKAEIAAAFIFPTIRRSRQNALNGAMGGRPPKENRGESDSGGTETERKATENRNESERKPPAKEKERTKEKENNTRQNKDKDKDETKTRQNKDTDKSKDKSLSLSVRQDKDGDKDKDNAHTRENGGKPPPDPVPEEYFSRFWDMYPKKVRKDQAREEFFKLDFFDIDFDFLILKLEEQTRSGEWQEDNGRYVPYPENWIRDRRWEDNVPLFLTKNDPFAYLEG